MTDAELIAQLYASLGEPCVTTPGVAHVEIHANRVLGLHLVPGLVVEAVERPDGVEAHLTVTRGTEIAQPVRICFGLLPESGTQHVQLAIALEEHARAAILASCTFPNARRVLHSMDAIIEVGASAQYVYLERHVHGPQGGVRVLPRARVILQHGARFRTEFELIRGQAGAVEIDYAATCQAHSVLEMAARISGRGDDRIAINERADLVGEYARGVLMTSIAVRERAVAEVRNTLVASAPYARGHVDCKEIVQGQAIAHAIPVVEVRHEQAHVTHEAAIGSVDAKQLETLMSRGLTAEQATDLIIEGLLSPAR